MGDRNGGLMLKLQKGIACAEKTCNKSFLPRMRSNDPAYCSYPCALKGQPEHAKASIFGRRQP